MTFDQFYYALKANYGFKRETALDYAADLGKTEDSVFTDEDYMKVVKGTGLVKCPVRASSDKYTDRNEDVSYYWVDSEQP